MRIKLGDKFIKFAYKFVDVESSGETATPDARMIEYSFVLSRLLASNPESLRILDVGSTAKINPIPATMCELGHFVWGIDRREFKYEHPNFRFVLGDIRKTGFPDNFFDVVCAVSSLEHIGIRGRYGIDEHDVNGDMLAMQEIRRITKDDGRVLITLPFDEKGGVSQLGRLYDATCLNELVSAWKLVERIFYCRNKDDTWVQTSVKIDSEESVVLQQLEK